MRANGFQDRRIRPLCQLSAKDFTCAGPCRGPVNCRWHERANRQQDASREDLWPAGLGRGVPAARFPAPLRCSFRVDPARKRRAGAPAGLRIPGRHPHGVADDPPGDREARLVRQPVARGVRPGDLRRWAGGAERRGLWLLRRSEDCSGGSDGRSAGRPRRAPGSRTIWAFPKAPAARNSPSERASRPPSSAPRSCSRARACAPR